MVVEMGKGGDAIGDPIISARLELGLVCIVFQGFSPCPPHPIIREHNIIHMQSSIVMMDLKIWASPSASSME